MTTEEGRGQTPALKSVLSRLQEHVTGEATINKRTEQIINLVGQHENIATSVFQKSLADYQRGSVSQEYFENMAATYLFAMNRQFIPETLFDEGKEKRQIKAVVALLSRNHDHLGTGEGKSSVVFPIVSIIEALSSKNHDVVLSTANTTLLADLKNNTERFLQEMQRQNALPADITIEEPGEPERTRAEELRQTMALLNEPYSEGAKEKIRNTYWETQLLRQGKERAGFLDKPPESPRIVLLTERSLVFTYEEDPKKFSDKAPNIFIDEADVPYNRNSPYEETQETTFFDAEAVQDSTFCWLLNYLVAQNLTSDDFELNKGHWQLKEEARERLRGLRFDQLKQDDPIFQKGVAIIAQAIGITSDEEGKSRLARDVFTSFTQNVSQMTLTQEPAIETLRQDIRDVVEGIADTIAALYNEGGVSYIKKPGDKGIKVRDQYLGKVIAGHEFLPEIQMAILALNDDFDFIPLEKKAGRVLHYQSFIAALGDRVRCASGSLLFPDLLTKEIRQSPFAYFLERATRKNVVLITPPELKTPPAPDFFTTDEAAIERLVTNHKQEAAKKPTLIVCWAEAEAEAIHQALLENFDSSKVGYISSDPHPEEEKRIYQLLAEGELDFVVSSGASGLGVDIKKRDGGFPDLKVELFNFPLNRLQVLQALSRRRMSGDDFAWYISHPALERLVSHFKYRESPVKRFLGAMDIEIIAKEINEAKNNPRKRLEIAMKLLKQAEADQMTNDAFVVAFDEVMDNLTEKAQRYVRNFLRQSDVDETQLEWLVHEYGLPEAMYYDVQKETSFIADAQNIEDLMFKLVHRLKKNPYDLKPWLESQKKRVDEFSSIVFKDGKIKNAYLVELQPVKAELVPFFKVELSSPESSEGWGYIPFKITTPQATVISRILVYRDSSNNLFLPTALRHDQIPAPIEFGAVSGKLMELVKLGDTGRSLLFALSK